MERVPVRQNMCVMPERCETGIRFEDESWGMGAGVCVWGLRQGLKSRVAA